MIANLGPAGREAKFYLHTENLRYTSAPDRSGLILSPTIAPTVLGGKSDGKEVEDGQLAANATARISFGNVEVRKGFIRLVVNPELYETAVVQGPTLLGADRESHEIFLVVRAQRATDLNLNWILKLYVEG